MTETVTKIAVITRTKNRNLLLNRALKSVEDQTFKDYVHVIVNDGGDKKSVNELVAKYKNKSRIVIHNKESIGLTKALNQGIQATKSKYIAILDDDDSLAKDRLEKTVDFLDRSNAKGVVNVMDRIIETIDGNSIKFVSSNRWHQETTSISLYKQCLDNYLSNGAFSYRRDVYEELDGYDETLEVAEDWDFGIRFLLKYDVEFLQTDYPLSFYHHRPRQKSSEGNSVFANLDIHEQQLNKLRNKYLRTDINSGRIGIGYIMNNLLYERERSSELDKKDIDKIVRLEGHINYVGEKIISKLKNKPTLKEFIDKKILNR